MFRKPPRRFYLVLAFLLAWIAPARGQPGFEQNPTRSPEEFTPEALHFFEMEIRPLLHTNCLACHSQEKKTSGLSLESRAAILQGGNRGPAVQPGDPEHSRLMQAVMHVGDLKMPPTGKLRGKEIATLRRWIELGVPWPETVTSQGSPSGPSDHWSFQPFRRYPAPRVKDTFWIRNSIDNFVLARLEKEGLEPSPEADRVTLIRRLKLDLQGLPPSPAEVDRFLADKRPDAYERLVDRLLESLHYGERWARHWLDVARYADTNGFGFDRPRVIWRFRDWVIRALNRDTPFDEFVIEQLAGDLLPNATLDQKIATGFHRNTMINQEGGVDQEQYRMEAIFDRVKTTGTVFLGLTVGCAQCHDHKYDPISQREYYRLFAFFNNQDELVINTVRPSEVETFRRISTDFKLEKLRLETEIAEREAELIDLIPQWEARLTEEQRKKAPPNIQEILRVPAGQRTLAKVEDLETFYKEERDPAYLERQRALELLVSTPNEQNPNQFTTMVLEEKGEPQKAHILIGGNFLKPGAEVSPGVPAILPPLETRDGAVPNRLDLARWLVGKKNPLTPRVTVNRIWQRYFGRGLVPTPEDFGTQGERPSHPELLDWLANEFMRQGWSLKALHRLIVTSATYRQSSRVTPKLMTRDPRNVLLTRSPRYRVEGEVVRDIALSVAGLIHHQIGGPSTFPPQPPGITDLSRGNLIWVTDTDQNRYRRSLYTFWKRTSPYPALITFDAPTADETAVRRDHTNTPLQSLVTLNDDLFVEAAQGLALRVLREAPEDDQARLEYAFRLCVARGPNGVEKNALATFLEKEGQRFRANPNQALALMPDLAPAGLEPWRFAAWFSVSRVLLNLDETITRE